MEKDYNDLEKDFPENAEHHWIYGNFPVSSGRTLDGNKQLEKYMEMKDYYIGSFFINDYASAQHMCDMPFNAYYTLSNGGTIPEENIQNQELLNIIKNRIKESSSQEKYETKQVWRLSQLKGDSSGGPGYYVIAPSQNRLQEPVTVIILIDSCNAFIEQTDQLLSELFSKAIFD